MIINNENYYEWNKKMENHNYNVNKCLHLLSKMMKIILVEWKKNCENIYHYNVFYCLHYNDKFGGWCCNVCAFWLNGIFV